MKQVYLIDFGMARRYCDSGTGTHLPDTNDHVFNENIIFCSVNQLKRHSFSRRDDIIMIIQTLIFMIDWEREWVENNPDIPGQNDRIRDFKLSASPKTMCQGSDTELLTPLMEEAYSYSYLDEPRYDKLINMLQDILKSKDQKSNMKLSFNYQFFRKFQRILYQPNQQQLDDQLQLQAEQPNPHPMQAAQQAVPVAQPQPLAAATNSENFDDEDLAD